MVTTKTAIPAKIPARMSGAKGMFPRSGLLNQQAERKLAKTSSPRGQLSRAYGPAPTKVASRLSPTAAPPPPPQKHALPALGMGLAHTRAGPGGAIARSGGKVVVLCYPLFVLPASALLLDLSISLLGYEALTFSGDARMITMCFPSIPNG